MGLFSANNSYLGIDIGSFSIKLVELTKKKGKMELSTYAFSENKKIFTDSGWLKDSEYVVKIIEKLYEESGATGKMAVSTIPSFSVFSSIINLHNVNKKDMDSAIEWEAKKLIPLPLEEMALGSEIIKGADNKKNTKVFLTGSPKKLIKKYINIFRRTDINLSSLETETFSLIRSLVGSDKSTLVLIQIGSSNTDISIIQEGIPILNRSIDIGGLAITKAISNSLNVGLPRAEQFKIDLGINIGGSGGDVIPKTIATSINSIINEIKYLLNLYNNSRQGDKAGANVEKIILTGGSAMLPNLVDYLSKSLNMNVIIGDPWSRISYPSELKPVLEEVGPRFAIAIGSAIKGIK